MGWQFWIDRGGTFTDVVARDPAGAMHIHKLLSDCPDRYPDAPLQAIRTLLGLSDGDPIPADEIDSVKMGTTLATNALLERKGVPTGLLTTKGFADLLEIGYQDRPEIFELDIRKPTPLAMAVAEVDERVLADGSVRTPLNEQDVRTALKRLKDMGAESLAVLFLHSFAYPDHELAVEALARKAGFTQVSLSHRVAREIKAVGRGDTTLADAYLTPILRDYVEGLRDELGTAVSLRFMQSNGGLTSAEHFSGKNAILSGPAGGVVAYAHICQMAGLDKVIGFDMGGTSTDVSRFDGRFERVYETQVAGVRLKAPMMAIETVAAGGGSIVAFRDSRLCVGPESAGADPGPACYRRGGPATVTDANLVLGRIQPGHFPACFGPDGDAPLDLDAARERLAALAKEMTDATGTAHTFESVALGCIRVANEHMAEPIKKISVSRGYDVQEYALCSFGGAGAQHACAIAGMLGLRSIVLHPLAGVLSAYGLGLADTIHTEVEAVLLPFDSEVLTALAPRFEAMETEGRGRLSEEGFNHDRIEHIRSLDMRYAGTDAFLNVPLAADSDVVQEFQERHQALYGFVRATDPIEVVNLRVESIGKTDKPPEVEQESTPRPVSPNAAIETVNIQFEESGNGARPTPVYRRADLEAGHTLAGPALIVEDVSTIVVDPGWTLEVNGFGHLILRQEETAKRERTSTECDPIMLEVFNNVFMSIAEQMGEILERVSHSVNIKERLDFSCALFDEHGELVANAPHIPVHLGAMSESVRAMIAERGDAMRPGDVYLSNDPYHGGSHLPDITAVTPVEITASDGTGRPVRLYVANRGHHADIGGITPGSMPPFSKVIDEEGVVIHNFSLVSEGEFREEAIVDLLRSGPYPARNIPERLSDLRAQIAANAAGHRLLTELCAHYGTEVVRAYMGHVRGNAATAMRNCIASIPDGVYSARDRLDGPDAEVVCTITIESDRAAIDFEGTSPQLSGNLNAPRAVVIAAVLYAFRCLIGKPVPLNGGCLEPIALRIPEGSLLSPAYPAAVVGGNVETSIRVVDVVFAALKAVAGSQGTMNNFTFGTGDWGYYETICGGAGAGPGFDGASAVHTHMTNTRITDPEVLERRYPVVLRKFSIRRGSGGRGDHTGGDGVVRAIEFLEPVSVGILSERRTTVPYSVGNAQPGQPGRNRLLRGDTERELPGHVELEVETRDIILIETPGGGGYSGA